MKSSSTATASKFVRPTRPARCPNRRGHVWTKRFAKVAHDAWYIKADSTIVDGAIVVPAADSTTDFSALQNELRGRSTKIVLVAFDLSLFERSRPPEAPSPRAQARVELRKIVGDNDIQFSDSFEIEGPEMFAHVCKHGLEGIVSKVRDGTYSTGRSNAWVKKTRAQRETLAIAGFALDGRKWTLCRLP